MKNITKQSTSTPTTPKRINWFSDFKIEGQSKMSVGLPYLIMLMPVISFILIYAIYLFTGKFCPVFHLNILPVLLTVFSIFAFFICVDIPQWFMNKNTPAFNQTVKNSLKNKPETLILCFMFAWILITGLFTPNFPNNYSFFHYENEVSHLQECIIYFFIYLVIFLSAVNLKNEKTRRNLLFVFISVTSLICILTLIFPHGELLISAENNTNWANAFVNSNHLGYVLCLATSTLAITFSLAKNYIWRIITGILLALHLFVSMFNDTLGSLLALTFTFIVIPIVVCIKEKRFNVFSFIPLVMLIAISFICIPLASPMDSTYKSLFVQIYGVFKDFFQVSSAPLAEETKKAGTNRWELWLDTFKAIKENPLVGDGDVITKPHNEYLQFAAHSGIISALAYIACFVIIAVKAIKYFKHLSNITFVGLIATMCYGISAFFGNTMPHTYPFFMVILGITISSLNSDISSYKSLNRNTTGIEKSFEFKENQEDTTPLDMAEITEIAGKNLSKTNSEN